MLNPLANPGVTPYDFIGGDRSPVLAPPSAATDHAMGSTTSPGLTRAAQRLHQAPPWEVYVARALRHENPRCGREQFDRRAGLEWEYGPGSNEIADSIPDVPWNKYKRTLEPANRVLFSNDQWAVTIFRLEPLYEADPERFEGYNISAGNLLQTYPFARVYYWPVKVAELPWQYFESFEEAFSQALYFHCRKRSIMIDNDMLERSFRRARAIARKRARR